MKLLEVSLKKQISSCRCVGGVLLFAFLMFHQLVTNAQQISVKTNLLYDATATINLGVEARISPRWTLDLSGNYHVWNLSEKRRLRHWMLQPEARLWFCDPFVGHFLGFHMHGGKYNVGGLKNGISFLGTDFSQLTDNRYQGWFLGAGVGYGYSWPVSRHWSIEGEVGFGYSYVRYDKYPCTECGEKLDEGTHHYVGPTKAAINLIYSF